MKNVFLSGFFVLGLLIQVNAQAGDRAGGGGDVTGQPVDEPQVTDSLKYDVPNLLPLVANKEAFLFRYISEYHGVTKDSEQWIDLEERMSKSYKGHAPNSLDILAHNFQSSQFEFRDHCYNPKGEERPASTVGMPQFKICVSPSFIVKEGKVNSTTLQREMIGLTYHELMHWAGFENENEVAGYQISLVDSINPQIKSIAPDLAHETYKKLPEINKNLVSLKNSIGTKFDSVTEAYFLEGAHDLNDYYNNYGGSDQGRGDRGFSFLSAKDSRDLLTAVIVLLVSGSYFEAADSIDKESYDDMKSVFDGRPSMPVQELFNRLASIQGKRNHSKNWGTFLLDPTIMVQNIKVGDKTTFESQIDLVLSITQKIASHTSKLQNWK